MFVLLPIERLTLPFLLLLFFPISTSTAICRACGEVTDIASIGRIGPPRARLTTVTATNAQFSGQCCSDEDRADNVSTPFIQFHIFLSQRRLLSLSETRVITWEMCLCPSKSLVASHAARWIGIMGIRSKKCRLFLGKAGSSESWLSFRPAAGSEVWIGKRRSSLGLRWPVQ